MFCECYGPNFIIIVPPRTQYLPVAGISLTDPWISQTDDERNARPRVFLKVGFLKLTFYLEAGFSGFKSPTGDGTKLKIMWI